MPDPHALAVAVRWLHAGAMAIAFGGAVLLVAAARGEPVGSERRSLVTLALRYELLFWTAVGVLAMTGVGNLAAFGASLPAPNSEWGIKFTIKLSTVIALAALSLPRSIAVAQLGSAALSPSASLSATFRVLYSWTAAALALLLALAVWLAHG